MKILGRKALAKRMEDEIEEAAALSKKQCEELHQEFKERHRRCDEAWRELRQVEAEIREIQGAGVSLLSRLNAVNAAGEEEKLQEFQKSYRENSRVLDRIGRRRDKAARKVAAAAMDEREAAEELARAGAAVVEEHAEQTAQVKARLQTLIEALDERHEEVALSAVPLTEEYERRMEPRSELKKAE